MLSLAVSYLLPSTSIASLPLLHPAFPSPLLPLLSYPLPSTSCPSPLPLPFPPPFPPPLPLLPLLPLSLSYPAPRTPPSPCSSPPAPPLPLPQAQTYLVKYGKRLMTAEPEYTSQVITSLCLGHWRQDAPPPGQPSKRARPEDFIHIFVNQTEHLVTFLASSVEVGSCWSAVEPLYKGHLSNEDTVCSPNHIELCTNLPLN